MDSWLMLVSIVTLWALFALIKQSGDGREGSHGGLEEPPYAAEPQNNREPPADPLSRGEQGFWVSFDKCTQPLPTRRSQQQVLNLLSERDHQLNCRLVEAALAACGLSYRSHTIVFGFVQGNLTVTIDGRRRPAQAKGHYHETWDDSAAFIERETFPGIGQVMVISTPLLILRLQAVQPESPEDAEQQAHLEFAINLLARPERLHGLLGQTARSAEGCPGNDATWQSQGMLEDYLVSELTASNADSAYPYNEFSGEHLGSGGRGPGAAEMPVVYEMLDQPLVAYSAGVNRLLTNL